jgi:hypothetical protein
MTRLLLGGLVACLVGAALFFFVPWAAAVARRREIMIITPWIWIAAAACFFAVLLLLLCGASALNVTAQAHEEDSLAELPAGLCRRKPTAAWRSRGPRATAGCPAPPLGASSSDYHSRGSRGQRGDDDVADVHEHGPAAPCCF